MLHLQPFEQYLLAGNGGQYSPFSYSIQCSTEDYPVYCHEYLHHIQNVTSIQGAERLSAFLQVIAHLSRLCAAGGTVIVPLARWVGQLVPDSIQQHELH